MRGRGARLAVVAALMALVVVPIVATPAAANHEEWGFSYLEVSSAPPGTEINFGIKRQISHDVPYAGDAFEPQPIRVADEQCGDDDDAAWGALLDASGRVLASETRVLVPEGRDSFGGVRPAYWTKQSIVIPDFVVPGDYYLRRICDYGTNDFWEEVDEARRVELRERWRAPEYQLPDGIHFAVACVRFEVTAPGESPGPVYFVYRDGGPLLRDPCPVSVAGVIDRSVAGLDVGFAGLFERFARSFLPQLTQPTPTTVPPTTSTTRPKAPTPPPAPAQDVTPPVITSLVFSGQCGPPSGTLQANTSDNVGVVSVSYSWSYSIGGVGGSGPMSGGPPVFTAALGGGQQPGGVLSYSATAFDAAGNASAPASGSC